MKPLTLEDYTDIFLENYLGLKLNKENKENESGSKSDNRDIREEHSGSDRQSS